MKVHKGDTVIVISGPDKGAKGKVVESFPKADKVLVEGVNRIKKHTSTSATAQGGIEVREAPIHVSNVMVVDPETKKGTRVGYRTEEVERDGRTRNVRVRVAKRSGKDI